MKYVNAKAILPDTLIEELQSYIQGGYIYIPTKPNHQKHWGELSGYREELQQRNNKITEEYHAGVSIEFLSHKHCLSNYAIRKIIYKK